SVAGRSSDQPISACPHFFEQVAQQNAALFMNWQVHPFPGFWADLAPLLADDTECPGAFSFLAGRKISPHTQLMRRNSMQSGFAPDVGAVRTQKDRLLHAARQTQTCTKRRRFDCSIPHEPPTPPYTSSPRESSDATFAGFIPPPLLPCPLWGALDLP